MKSLASNRSGTSFSMPKKGWVGRDSCVETSRPGAMKRKGGRRARVRNSKENPGLIWADFSVLTLNRVVLIVSPASGKRGIRVSIARTRLLKTLTASSS